ncbi:hypothetical protein M433DRAFT_155494 [Acidomyces richmondensis BFW]|nr:MAG: hypothetical protein FE78DRAFT_90503 [Acidomyces sp. 'richmondensis']KYG44548.1 hypothetical protein M433DRAFT_155494 [Acidomyces richmondensis BFW]
MLLNLFSIFLCLCSLSSAARLTISIPSGSPALPNAGTLPSSTHAVLTGPPGIRYDAPLRRDNTFIFPDLGDASYLLAVYSRDYFFPPLRVDVQQAGDDSSKQSIHVWQTFRGNEWGNKGPLFGSGTGELTISIAPSTRKDFYLPRGGFNLVGFLKNPMILMALVSVVFIFGVPYMMDNMDPEMRAEFEEMQKKSPLTGSQGAAGQVQNFDLAGFLAGKSTSTDKGSSESGKKR